MNTITITTICLNKTANLIAVSEGQYFVQENSIVSIYDSKEMSKLFDYTFTELYEMNYKLNGIKTEY